MQLTEEQIRRFTYGAVSIEKTERGFTFHRMTYAMRAGFAPFCRNADKCAAAAGVHLEFMTDASELVFRYRDLHPCSSRNFGLFDVTVDGVLVRTFGEDPISAGEGDVTVPLPGTFRRVTVWFPNLSGFTLAGVELPDGSRAEPAKKERKILALGDSITQGYDAHHPSLSYVDLLAERFRAEVWNCAVGGAMFRAATIDPAVPFRPDFITVAYGTNDWANLASAEELEQNARAYLEKLLAVYPGTRIFLILPIWRGDGDQISRVGAFEKVYGILGKTARLSKCITPVNGQKLTPHTPDFYSDGFLHPNDTGFVLYAHALGDEISRVLDLYAGK